MELPPERLCGHVIDADGLQLEVWGIYGPGESLPFAVSVNYDGSQLWTFSLGQAGTDAVLQLAERVARGEAKILAVTTADEPADVDDEDEVIDTADTESLQRAWRSRHGNNTIH